jgi:3',5'-nucleoside bisphosphate phosphatase
MLSIINNRKRAISFFILLLSAMSLEILAQNTVNNIQLPELRRDIQRTHINLPNLDGYVTLKVDFHMHTVFSDGDVWPTMRVREAWEEGLDAISITEHIEYRPKRDLVKGDHNSPYDIALPASKDYNIILIRGGEITRDMPPGHLNAIFLEDVNKLEIEDPIEAIMEAHRQGAFITFNHPGWKAQQPDTCLLFDVHKDLIQKGVIHAMEIFNEKEWYPMVLGWCIEYNLAVTGYSDIHDVNAHYYPLDKYHRPMTLVFAKERSAESIKEAMFARRTAAWFSKYLAGKEELLSELYNKSIIVKAFPEPDSRSRKSIEVTNNSDFIFEFKPEQEGMPAFTVQPNSTAIVRFVGEYANIKQANYRIDNWFTNLNQNLSVTLRF